MTRLVPIALVVFTMACGSTSSSVSPSAPAPTPTPTPTVTSISMVNLTPADGTTMSYVLQNQSVIEATIAYTLSAQDSAPSTTPLWVWVCLTNIDGQFIFDSCSGAEAGSKSRGFMPSLKATSWDQAIGPTTKVVAYLVRGSGKLTEPPPKVGSTTNAYVPESNFVILAKDQIARAYIWQ